MSMVIMSQLIELLLLMLAGTLLVPILVLFIECCAALLPNKFTDETDKAARPKIAVLVPAHNEAVGISKTLNGIKPQLTATDRLVVVADNCEDNTAAIARNLGAIVIERQDAENRGKGYALDFGIKYLAADPPDIVTIIDADCEVSPGTIDKIALLAFETNKPVQATNLLDRPPNPSPKDTISALAFRVKNLVRTTGLKNLGLPCLLSTGIAFPWSVIQGIELASDNLVEDMQLSVDLAINGHKALFCPEARITGPLPQQQQAAMTQKTRWEHGHLQTILTQSPKLLRAAWQQRSWELLAMALDLSVPPLSLLTFLWLASTTLSLLAGIWLGIWSPVIVSSITGVLFFSSIIISWARFAREDIKLDRLLFIPVYIVWKIPLYLRFLFNRQKVWVRTQREEAN